MNVVSKALPESKATHLYVAPHAKVVQIQSEGVMCISVIGIGHDDFTIGGEYDL